MLGICYPYHAPLQNEGQQKLLKQRFHGYSYKDLNGSDMSDFVKCFNLDEQDDPDEYDQFRLDWHWVVDSYNNDRSGLPVSDRLWRHVLKKTGGDESEASRLYKKAVEVLEKKARDVYVEEDIKYSEEAEEAEFVEGMTKQGCIILQFALCFLGGPKPLGYPPDDPLFSQQQWNYKLIRFFVYRYIFSARNQIPLIVIKELMKQKFFQKVLEDGKWKRPEDLAGMALYDFLVAPMLLDHPVLKKIRNSTLVGVFQKRNRWYQEQPATLLHALWLLLTGPPVISSSSHGGTNHIEEEEDVEGGHLYTTLSTMSGAKDLQASGITFKGYEGFEIRRIKFHTWIEAYLYLPCIYMEPNIIALFKNLIFYEGDVNLHTNRREVSAYICFMNELIRSHDDVKVLVTAGIIGSDPEYEENLPKKLSKLASQLDRTVVGNSHNFGAIRRQIGRYVKPSLRTKIVNFVAIGVLFSTLQIIYTALNYHHPNRH